MSNYNVPLELESKNSLSLIVNRIKPNSKILEFGPANGRLTKYMKEKLNCKVYCVEIDENSAKDASQYAEMMVIDSIENYSWKKKFEDLKFDYIIFADVLEHLYYPEKVLNESKCFLTDTASVLVSIPNIAHSAIILGLLKNEFNYSPTGLLDNTHIRFFTKKTFDQLIEDNGYFKAFETATFERPENTELFNSYNDVPSTVGEYISELYLGEAYQFIYELKISATEIVSEFEQIKNNINSYFIQLFIKDENGLSEENSIKCTVLENNHTQYFEFDLSEKMNIKSLRLDPLNQYCVIKINSITINDIELQTSLRTNAFYVEDSIYYFMTNDSQIHLDTNDVVINNFKINLEYLHLGDDSGNYISNLLTKRLESKNKELKSKNKELKSKNKELKSKDKKIFDKEIHIQNIESLAQSLRLKNRIKSHIKKIIPLKVWNILRYIKSNPSSLKLGLYTLKSQGFKALYNRIQKVNNLSEDRISNTYEYQQQLFTKEIKKEIKSFRNQPLISIIMPVYNVDPKWLDLAIKSIENQWYENWELCIADDKSTNKSTLKYLKSIKSKKIKIKFMEENQNISGASNEALKLVSGEYIALMDNDDEITPNALYEVIKAINKTNAEFIYSDEDKMEMDGTYCDPHFKPDFAPDMFLSQNYMSHFGVIKKSLIDRVGGWEIGLEGAQDYDLYLKVLEHTEKISHISKVLYHWRKIPGSTAAEFSEKSYAQDIGTKALNNALKRRDISATATNGKYPGTYKVAYEIENNSLVSIIIPFKDMPELLTMCIESILDKSTYKNFEIIGISNNSEKIETFKEMARLKKLDKRINFYEYNVPFNYSDINNHAVKTYARGEHILLLNNDIEIISENWLEEMLMHSQRKEVGCVGAKLYYPNGQLQHAGVIIGIGGIAGHSHKYFDRENPGYFSRLNLIQNVSAVTAACLIVKKDIFDEVNGLNENDLKIAFNDVDFCLRVQELGYKNVFTPYCEAYHHESISRGAEDNPEKLKRFNREVEYMKKKHGKILKDGDPFYNVNLTLKHEDFSLMISKKTYE